MTKPSITTDLDRDPAWWSAWFEADYSWDGLARKDWYGWVVVAGRCVPKDQAPKGQVWPQASLQDYWRADPDNGWILRDMPAPGEALSDAELIDLGGTIWHRAHLPPATQHGERSWKADPKDERFEAHWENLTTDLQTRLKHGFETQMDSDGDVEGADGRLQGAGLVLKSLPQPGQRGQTPLHLSMHHAVFLQDVFAEGYQFGPGNVFIDARFVGSANFQDTSFAGKADFSCASFASGALFQNAIFTAYVEFRRVSFAEKASFRDVSFANTVDFHDASFAGDADFLGASFAIDANFYDASFGADAFFQRASFAGDAGFAGVSFAGGAYFYSANFVGFAGFYNALFSGSVDFTSAVFLSVARFHRVAPQAHLGEREAGALMALDMPHIYCLDTLDFSDQVFGEAPNFAQMVCAGVPEFFGAKLHDGINLSGASFRHDDPAVIISWDQLAERLKDQPGFVDEKGEVQIPTTEALRIVLEHWLLEKDLKQVELVHPFWNYAFYAWHAYARRLPLSDRPEDPTGLNWSDIRGYEFCKPIAEDAREFEKGYRRLKLLMGGMGAHIEEQRFFACELRARQTRDPKTDQDIKTWEVLAARAYGTFADYGRSAVRPVFWLGALWAGFFFLYSFLAVGSCALPETGCPVRHQIAEGVDRANPPTQLMEGYAVLPQLRRDLFALTRAGGQVLSEGVMNGPFLFAAELTVAPVANPIRHHEWAQSLVERGDGWSTLFGFARWLHRVLALPLIFLFALALRRRFQLG